MCTKVKMEETGFREAKTTLPPSSRYFSRLVTALCNRDCEGAGVGEGGGGVRRGGEPEGAG